MAILPPDPSYVLRGDMGPIHSLMFKVSPYIEHIYAGTESGNVHIWDLQKNRETSKITPGKEPCLAIHDIAEDCLVTQQKGGIFDVFYANGSSWIRNNTIETNYCGFSRCQVLKDGCIVIPLKESTIGSLSLKTNCIEYKLNPLQHCDIKAFGEVMAIKPVKEKDHLILVAYESGHVALWDIRKQSFLNSYLIEDCPMALDVDGSMMRGILGSSSNNLHVFNITNTSEIRQKSTIDLKNPGTSAVALRPDYKVFCTGGWDGRLRIFSWKTLRPLACLDQHRDSIQDVIYSKTQVPSYNCKYLMAAAGKDGSVSLWNLYN